MKTRDVSAVQDLGLFDAEMTSGRRSCLSHGLSFSFVFLLQRVKEATLGTTGFD